ncbi:substance-K receptor-like [Mizuhopecten yessoensis]|uniref:Tachykinin-like peptides receptor 99D n=1 Tax=Mizuhopecten yessoensis TaxID=6573 RepID=A0A210PFG5_MIZYE|nr:substance-K receptor-like [Mizuhopecten yessoensis]OWF35228.1 Tachykinin-like peptides receptor 99D [Mizuhopecten yessoensis]
MTDKCGDHPFVDVSKNPFPGELKTFPSWELGVKITIVASMELIAIVGNLLIIVIVWRNKKMRTVTNYYIVNMAVSDLFVASFSIWMHLVDDVTEGWTVGGFMCKFNPFVQITAMCASVFTLMALACDRFFAIMFPLKSRVTQRKVSVVAVFVWLAAISIGMPVLFVYTYNERQWSDFTEKFCTDVWPSVREADGDCDSGRRSRRAFWTCVVVVLNWIPMLVMAITYSILFIRLRKQKIVPSSGSISISTVQQKSKKKVVKMLFAVLLAFIVCTIPFQVAKLYELYREVEDQTGNSKLPDWYNPVYFAAVTLLYSNSAINPMVYGGMNENFRKGLKDTISGLFSKHERSRSDSGRSLNISDTRQSVISKYNGTMHRDSMQAFSNAEFKEESVDSDKVNGFLQKESDNNTSNGCINPSMET